MTTSSENHAPTGELLIAGATIPGWTLWANDQTSDADGISMQSFWPDLWSYRWQSSMDGITWTDIAGATGKSFTLTDAQLGLQVRAVVSWIDGLGKLESVASAASAAVSYVNPTPIVGTDAADYIFGTVWGDTMIGLAGNDTLDGLLGNDTLIGGLGDDAYVVDSTNDAVIENADEGRDIVYASASYTLSDNVEDLTLTGSAAIDGTGNSLMNTIIGNDAANVLDGKGGDDYLDGGRGNDTYVFDRGYGQCYVIDSGGSSGNIDAVQLAAGVSSSDVFLASDQFGDLLLAIADRMAPAGYTTTGYADEMFIQFGLDASMGAIEQIKFADGTVWDVATMNETGQIVPATAMNFGTSDADVLAGTPGDDSYLVNNAGDVVAEDPDGGVDRVYASVDYVLPSNVEQLTLLGNARSGTGNTLDNVLQGTCGDDILQGLDGNDVLVGGAGNDILVGGADDDLYEFDIGGGHDVIQSSDGLDTLAFGTGIRAADVGVGRDGNDLVLTLNGQDSVRFSNRDGIAVDRVTFADGTVWRANLDGSGFNARCTGGLTIVGDCRQGETLRVLNTIQDSDGLGAFSYQWQRGDGGDWTDIAGATQDNFTLGEAEVGMQVRVHLTFTDGRGNAEEAIGYAREPIANVNDAPTGSVVVSGIAVMNEVLAASNTLADLDGLGPIGYQWQSSNDGTSWADIDGATASTFTLSTGQLGMQVRAVASYTDGHGTAEGVASAATAKVNALPTGSVLIAGTPTQRNTLTGKSALADADGMGPIAYQWQSSPDGVTWTDIGGATTDFLNLGEAQVGLHVRVVVGYTDGHGTAESAASAATAAVANVNDPVTGGVTIIGTPTENQVLTASNNFADADGLGAISYQWQVLNGTTWTNIQGATANTFKLTEAEVGKRVWVVASYTDGHGTFESKASAATAAVANVNEAPTGMVVVSGAAARGQVLTAVNTLADADGLGTIAYQWQSSLNGGTTWANIAGATASTLTLGDAQLSKQVRVVASYTDGHGTIESVRSMSTGRVVIASQVLGTGNADSLRGTSSGDVLLGLNGIDTLDGIAGTDTLVGGLGNDIYVMGRGYGADTIVENDSTAGNTDSAWFLSGIATDQIWFRHVGNDLEASIIGTGDKLIVQNWYAGSAFHVEQFKTADGKTLVGSRVETLVQAMAAFAAPASGQTTLPPAYQTALAPVLAANWQ